MGRHRPKRHLTRRRQKLKKRRKKQSSLTRLPRRSKSRRRLQKPQQPSSRLSHLASRQQPQQPCFLQTLHLANSQSKLSTRATCAFRTALSTNRKPLLSSLCLLSNPRTLLSRLPSSCGNSEAPKV